MHRQHSCVPTLVELEVSAGPVSSLLEKPQAQFGTRLPCFHNHTIQHLARVMTL